MPIKKIQTGVRGLDEILEGGFNLPSTVLIAGEPGTGKTTLGVQSLFYGASPHDYRGQKKESEVGLYITAISEPQWVVQRFLSNYDFYNYDMIEAGRVIFQDIGKVLTETPDDILNTIQHMIEKYQPKRIVIDPITIIEIAISDPKLYRKYLHELIAFMKAFEAVSLIVGEFTYDDIPHSVISYMVDGVLILSYPEDKEGVRRKQLEVLKMRGTRHFTGRKLVDVTTKGFTVV